MKGNILAVFAVLCLLVVTGLNALAEPTGDNFAEPRRNNWLSVGYGGFNPGGDLGDAGYLGGPNITLSYVRLFENYFGFEIDLNRYSAEYEGRILGHSYREDLTTTSIEFLFLVRPNDEELPDLQPYVGIGLGSYVNEFSYDWEGQSAWSDSRMGAGFVAKAGLRLFLTDRMYIGGSAKYFTNNQEVYVIDVYGNRQTETLQIGGCTAYGELGFSF